MKISGISRTPKLGEIGGESRLSEYTPGPLYNTVSYSRILNIHVACITTGPEMVI